MNDAEPGQLQLLNVIFDNLGDAIVTVTSDQRIYAVNRAITTLLGYEPHALIGHELTVLVPARYRDAHQRGVAAYFASAGQARNTQGYVEVLALAQSGEEIPASLSMACIQHQGQLYMTGVLRDMRDIAAARATISQQVVELAAANARLKQLADEDHLTGLLNRRAMQRELQQMWRTSAVGQAPLGILICDIDHFKLFNDTYGHLRGDSCLAAVASAIRSAVQNFGVAARFGGEEYIVLLRPNASMGLGEAAALIRNAVAALRIPHSASSVSHLVTLSIGGAMHQAHHRNAQAVLRHADDALYVAKRLRNRYVQWDEKLTGS
ncbi:sensor domain-containing diguanylate cyclase [Curvibacter gracilis]|uniref:sensor domain-containing diguanylate cyclase n=1 Tax=Curvibacter gracilis TaxID=230310 RepID=UPI0004ACD64B|nr:sensor domain-containing diguanylate cyclase [Curvibacter gracilis]